MGVNKAILLGRLGADPELRYTTNNQAVCRLRVATTERRQNAEGEWVDATEWHSVTVWGKSGENCAQYLSKGREVFVEGRIQTRKWQDKEGKDRYNTEVVANRVEFIGGSRGESAGGIERSSTPAARGSDVGAGIAPLAEPVIGQGISLDDDDIPF